MRNPEYYEYDVSFLGNMDGLRYKEHAERQRFFEALCPRLDAMGVRYYIKHSSGISEAEQIRVIQRSRINLSYRSSCDHGGELSWGLPERCYGVPARGGFLLTDQREHAKDDFDLATEWAGYEGFEDCLVKIRYWLDHFAESRALAEAAHSRVMRGHTYEDRARNLLRNSA
jgi:spore maturation protein CgeB